MPNNSSFTILIVDDKPQPRKHVTTILERAGYRVIPATSGQEALDLLLSRQVDLVFMDLKLPDLNGIDLLGEIRRETPKIPVIILTALASLEAVIAALRKGARDYLIRPVQPAELLQRVEEILAERAQSARQGEIVLQLENLLSELIRPGSDHERKAAAPGRAKLASDRFVCSGNMVLDRHIREVRQNGRTVRLPPTTFEYLETLVRHSPEPVEYETLVKESQGHNLTRMEAREMAVWHIHELRQALEPNPQNPQFIFTVRNFGYRFLA